MICHGQDDVESLHVRYAAAAPAKVSRVLINVTQNAFSISVIYGELQFNVGRNERKYSQSMELMELSERAKESYLGDATNKLCVIHVKICFIEFIN